MSDDKTGSLFLEANLASARPKNKYWVFLKKITHYLKVVYINITLENNLPKIYLANFSDLATYLIEFCTYLDWVGQWVIIRSFEFMIFEFCSDNILTEFFKNGVN